MTWCDSDDQGVFFYSCDTGWWLSSEKSWANRPLGFSEISNCFWKIIKFHGSKPPTRIDSLCFFQHRHILSAQGQVWGLLSLQLHWTRGIVPLYRFPLSQVSTQNMSTWRHGNTFHIQLLMLCDANPIISLNCWRHYYPLVN